MDGFELFLIGVIVGVATDTVIFNIMINKEFKKIKQDE